MQIGSHSVTYLFATRRSPDLRGLGVKPDLIQAHNLDELQINLPIHSLFSTKDSGGQLAPPVSHSLYRWISEHGRHGGVLRLRSSAQRHASTALILLIALAALVPILTSAGNNRVETPRTTIEAPTAKLGYAGIDPTAVSLNWTRSTDSTFFEYTIRESFNISNGFETVANIQNSSTTSYYASGQVPEGNEWWQIIYRNQSKSQSSNPLEVTQPPVASLSYSMLGSTSIELVWNNKATYGGLVSFNSYQLMRSVSGRANSSVAVIRDVNTLSYKVIGLAPTSEYSFYLNTTDHCEGCSPPSLSSTISNIVNVNTPPLLAAPANAYPSTIDAGQSLTITAVAANGSGGYN